MITTIGVVWQLVPDVMMSRSSLSWWLDDHTCSWSDSIWLGGGDDTKIITMMPVILTMMTQRWQWWYWWWSPNQILRGFPDVFPHVRHHRWCLDQKNILRQWLAHLVKFDDVLLFVLSIWEGKKVALWIGEIFTEYMTIERWRRRLCWCFPKMNTMIMLTILVMSMLMLSTRAKSGSPQHCQQHHCHHYHHDHHDHKRYHSNHQGKVRFCWPPHALGPSCQVLAGKDHLVIIIMIIAFIIIIIITIDAIIIVG